MASSKKIGFFWGEDKITLVEFRKDNSHRVFSSPIGSKTDTSSPFSSNLTEEIQTTATFQKILKDNQLTDGSFYVSLPRKEIILRSFILPFVSNEDIHNVVEFEARKYMPFDIQDLSFVFYAIPFLENKVKRLHIIFFAVRKEILDRYERILKAGNVKVFCYEPYIVSLSKVLLYKKEIKPADRLAFLILDKNTGRICFIDNGIPRFIHEFLIGSSLPPEEGKDPVESLNLKIVNEVGNSFNFYTRQCNGARIDQMFISADSLQHGLLNDLEKELKVKLTNFVPIVTAGPDGQNNDMDAVYAMGACITSSMETLMEFNFLKDETPKFKAKRELIGALKTYKETVFWLFICLLLLIGVNSFFQARLKNAQQQYNRITSSQGQFLNMAVDSIKTETQQYVDKLTAYKNIRTKSDMSFILLKLASHLPPGALLNQLAIQYNKNDPDNSYVTIDMKGDVFSGDPHGQMAVVNQIFADIKEDKELSKFIKNVSLLSLIREEVNNQQATGFNIHCS
ncbi:MAG: hypothetical protein HQL12_06970 [Candidatus Omnitrophica bacterium]|nr:hypothetical protein [Candidatus Omnitrophota bacterium]